MVARAIVVRSNFQEGFGHYTDQKYAISTEVKANYGKALEDSIQMDWTLEG